MIIYVARYADLAARTRAVLLKARLQGLGGHQPLRRALRTVDSGRGQDVLHSVPDVDIFAPLRHQWRLLASLAPR